MSSNGKSHREWLPETEALYAKLHSEKGWIRSRSTKTDTQTKYMFTRVETRNGPVIHFAMFLHPGGKIRGLCQFGEDACGFNKGTVHGGAIATLLDTVMGVLATMGTKKVYTVYLNVTFKRLTPMRAAVLMEATIDRIEGKKMFLKGFLKSTDEKTTYSECNALFIDVDAEKAPASKM